jgi:hypothetical protein
LHFSTFFRKTFASARFVARGFSINKWQPCRAKGMAVRKWKGAGLAMTAIFGLKRRASSRE